MSFQMRAKQLHLCLNDECAAKFSRVYGYIGEIKFFPVEESFGTETPAALQILAHLPFRYGSQPVGIRDGWASVRLTAFVSAAAFELPVSLLRVGGPVTWFVEQANAVYKSAQLASCSRTPASEWKLMRTTRFPTTLGNIVALT